MNEALDGVKAYTKEEIELFLAGDRREVDRLILHSVNNMATTLAPHMRKTNEVLDAIGPSSTVRARMEWIDAQIEKQAARTKMMQRVSESLVIWVLIGFLGFLGYSILESLIETFKHGGLK